jgi:4-amino-4-deoxy-L-arabinose transferase-like glycosyltransferase
MTKNHILWLSLILAIGMFFRFYLIGKMPGGLFPDEAANGLDINNIFKGHLEPFFGRGNGREALFFYLQAASVALFGRGFWQHHIVSALVGALSILATYLFASRLINRRVGLLAAFFMATGTWAIVLSRTAFRANLIALFLPLCLYSAVCAIQSTERKWRYIHSALFGFMFAGGFYTYIAFRIIVLILFIFAVIVLIADRKQNFTYLKEFFKPSLAALGGFIAGFAWLGYYFITHPGSFIGRSGQVSVFNSDLNNGDLIGTFIDVFVKSIMAFFTEGDLNWRHNISGLPFLSPLISPFFGITLVIITFLAAKYFFQSFKGTQNNSDIKYLLLAGLFWGMLVPVVTTAEGIPHGLRSIGMLPTAYILAAVGVDYFIKLTMRIWHYRWMEKIYYGVAVLFCVVMVLTSYFQYFIYAYNSPENFEAFRSDLSTVSSYINSSNLDKGRTYLVLDLFSLQTVDYLTTETNQPYIVVDPANAYKLRLSQGDKVIFTNSTLYDSVSFENSHRNARVIIESKDRFSTTNMKVYEILSNDSSRSLSTNSGYSFNVLNFGDRIDFSWQNVSYDPWVIKIWKCMDSVCNNKMLVKENNQNDYLSNHDWISVEKQENNLHFQAIAYDSNGREIKNYGIVKVQEYK